MRQGGDDLDDDFVPDELVALSDGEEPVGGSASDPADDVHGSLSVEEEASDDGEAERKNEGKKEKKRKRREKEKERKAKVCLAKRNSPLSFIFKSVSLGFLAMLVEEKVDRVL